MKLPFLLVAMALAASGEEPTLPGGVTLSEYTLSDRAFDSKGYVTPAHLRYPYVSTYYVKPIVLEGESVKVGYYVTDWNHSKARFRDDSARFDVTLRLTCGDGKWIERTAKNVKTGDGEIEVGALPKGTWHLSVTAYDRQAKLPSHTVWQEFRVEAKDFWTISAEKVCHVTAKDLADYGIRGGGDVERIVPVDVSSDKTFAPDSGALNWKTGDAAALKHVDAYLAAHPHVDDAARPGYAVYVAADAKGVPISRAFARLRVVYDKGYDREAMARQALTNSVGITRLLADKAAAGFRKIVFVKDTYRVSHRKTISLPDRTVVDFAGATLKMNGFTGCRAEQVTLPAVTDTVFENCIVEGLSFPQEGADASKLTVSGGATGLFRDCAFKGIGISVGNAENCTFRDTPHRWTGWQWHGAWKNCRAEGGCVFLPNSTNFFENCSFKDFTIQANQGGYFLNKCSFENAGFPPEVRKDMVGILKDCTFEGKCVFPPCFKDRPPQGKR